MQARLGVLYYMRPCMIFTTLPSVGATTASSDNIQAVTESRRSQHSANFCYTRGSESERIPPVSHSERPQNCPAMARTAALLVLLCSFALSLTAGILPRRAEYYDPGLLRCSAHSKVGGGRAVTRKRVFKQHEGSSWVYVISLKRAKCALLSCSSCVSRDAGHRYCTS